MGETADPGKSMRYGAAVEEGPNGQAVDAFHRRTAGAISRRTFVDAPLNPGAAAVVPGDTGPPPDLRGHLPALDGMRGLAVLMVLVFHFVGQMLPTNAIERAIVGVTKHGLLGVDLFFVLSGFLITGLLYEAHNKPHYLRNFYMRRLLRIFPLYYGVLALVFLVAPLIPLIPQVRAGAGADAR